MLAKLTATALFLAALLTAGFYLIQPNQVPDIELINLKGEAIRLAALRGHPVLVSFWASDCRACIEEMPELLALYNEYAPRGFKLLAIAMQYDPPSRVLNLAKAQELPYTVILDPLGQAAAAFGHVTLIPHHFLVDTSGYIHYETLGKISRESLAPVIENLLKEN